jgi:hypothetical protein
MMAELYRFEETARQGEGTLAAAQSVDNQSDYKRQRNHEQ